MSDPARPTKSDRIFSETDLPARIPGVARTLFLLLIIGAVGTTYVDLATQNPYSGFQADDALYLLMADMLSPTVTAELPVYHHVRAHSQLPPLFSLALGISGGGSDNPGAARTFVALAMTAAIILFYAWLRCYRAGRWASIALAALFAVMPITVIHVVDIWSEGLYLAFSLASLMLLDVARRSDGSVVICLACGVAVGCAVATRSVGFALLPAMVVVCVLADHRRVWFMWPGLALLLGATAVIDMGHQGVSYLDLLLTRYGISPLAAITGQIETSARVAWQAFAYDLFQWRDLQSPVRVVILAISAALTALGLLTALRRLRPDAVYFCSYGVIVGLWPYPELFDRFVFPLVPLILFYLFRGGALVGGRFSRESEIAGTITLVLMAALVLPATAATAKQALHPFPDPDLPGFRTTRYWLDPTRPQREEQPFAYMHGLHESLAMLAQHVPPQACVHTVLTNLVLLKAKRIAILPVAEARLRAGDPGDCDYFYITPTAAHGRPSMYPYEWIKSHTRVVSVHRTVPAEAGGEGGVVGILLQRR